MSVLFVALRLTWGSVNAFGAFGFSGMLQWTRATYDVVCLGIPLRMYNFPQTFTFYIHFPNMPTAALTCFTDSLLLFLTADSGVFCYFRTLWT